MKRYVVRVMFDRCETLRRRLAGITPDGSTYWGLGREELPREAIDLLEAYQFATPGAAGEGEVWRTPTLTGFFHHTPTKAEVILRLSTGQFGYTVDSPGELKEAVALFLKRKISFSKLKEAAGYK